MLQDTHIILSEWIGQLVEIHFYDHVSGDEVTKISNCRVWGKLISFTEREVVIQQWETDRSLTENTDNVVLVRSAIINVILLEKVN